MGLEDGGHLLAGHPAQCGAQGWPQVQSSICIRWRLAREPVRSHHYCSLWLLCSGAVMSFEMCLQLLTHPVVVVGLAVTEVILIQAFPANDNESQYRASYLIILLMVCTG